MSARQGLSLARPRAALPALPGAVVLVLGVILAASHGGFAASTWYPVALTVLAAALLLALLAPPDAHDRTRAVRATLLLYGGFCLVSYLSILWSDVPGTSWDAGNRAALYGVVLWLICARPWTPATARWGLLCAVLAIVGVALGTLVATTQGDARHLLLDGRLSLPFGYANATADFWLIGLFPALWLVCDPGLSWPLRAVALGAAGLLLEISVLSQSRGSAVALGVVALLFVAFVPRRWPVLIAGGACGVAVAASWGPLTHVRDVASVGGLGPALGDARRAILIGSGVLVLVGAGLVLADRWLWSGRERRARLGRLGDWVLLAIAGAAVVAGLAAVGNPAAWLRSRYHDFKTAGYTRVESGPTRFAGSLGSNRYDFYRVSLHEFERHPLAGIGADNFAVPYLRLRRSPETPTYSHSFVFGTMAGLGLLGAILFLGFLAAGAVGVGSAARAREGPPPDERASASHSREHRPRAASTGVAVAAGAGFCVFTVHGMADWLWQFPALGVMAFALLGLALQAGQIWRPGEPAAVQRVKLVRQPAAWPPGAGPLRRALLAIGALALGISFALPGLAASLTEGAYRVSASDPAAALARLDRARDLNFLRADPLLAGGLIRMWSGHTEPAVADLRRALAREPRNWFVRLELAIAEQNLGQRAAAARDAAAAVALNPRQPVTGQVQAQIAAGRHVDAVAISRALQQQLSGKLKPTG